LCQQKQSVSVRVSAASETIITSLFLQASRNFHSTNKIFVFKKAFIYSDISQLDLSNNLRMVYERIKICAIIIHNN